MVATSTSINLNLESLAEQIWRNSEKLPTTLVALLYGSIVHSTGSSDEHRKMGFNIGCRIVDDLLSKLGLTTISLSAFPAISESSNEFLIKLVFCFFKIYFGISSSTSVSEDDNNCLFVTLESNPLEQFIDYSVSALPEDEGNSSWRSTVVSGMLEGIISSIGIENETLEQQQSGILKIAIKDI